MTEKRKLEADVFEKMQQVATEIEQEIACINIGNIDRTSSGVLKYQCRHIFNRQRVDIFSGQDFLYGGSLFEMVQYEESCLKESDIFPTDIFIKAGHFAAYVKEYLTEHYVNIGPRYFETNTYTNTSRLGIRIVPNTPTIVTKPRHKFYVKFPECLEFLRSNILRVAVNRNIGKKSIVPALLPSSQKKLLQASSSSSSSSGSNQVCVNGISNFGTIIPTTTTSTTIFATKADYHDVPDVFKPVAPATATEEYIMDLMQSLFERVERLEAEILAFRQSKQSPVASPTTASATAAATVAADMNVAASDEQVAPPSEPPEKKKAKRNDRK